MPRSGRIDITTLFSRPWVRSVALRRSTDPLGPSLVLPAQAAPAHAHDVRFQRVSEGVFANVGDLGGRTAANQVLNATVGLLLTPGGATLIDNGYFTSPRVPD